MTCIQFCSVCLNCITGTQEQKNSNTGHIKETEEDNKTKLLLIQQKGVQVEVITCLMALSLLCFEVFSCEGFLCKNMFMSEFMSSVFHIHYPTGDL